MNDPRREPCGDCPQCGRWFRLTKAGNLWHHGDGHTFPPRRCEGAGGKPERVRWWLK